jgi:mannobiose 2-epimerase
LFELIERHAHDTETWRVYRGLPPDWSAAGAEARLSDKDMNEKKSMNNHLHVLEAYTNLHRVWPGPARGGPAARVGGSFSDAHSRSRAPGICTIFLTNNGRVRSDTYTFGHDIEASWLLCEAAEELGDAALLQARSARWPCRWPRPFSTRASARMAAFATKAADGRIIDAGRECWPQAEALVGFSQCV